MRRSKGIPGVSIYKPAARHGPQHKWMVAWYENGQRHVETASADYKVTRSYALKIAARLDQRRLGLLTTREEKIAAYAALPLLKGLDEQGEEVERLNHLSEYQELLTARKRTAKQVQQVGSRIARVFRMAEFEVAGDITSDGVELALGQLGDEEELADATCCYYGKACKQFTRWLRRSGRAQSDALEDLELPSIVDLVHLRRALVDAEVQKLMHAAEAGGVYMDRITGSERALVYLLAVETGLRANELRTLTPEAFRLDANPPLVIVEAMHSKHRKRDEQPIRRDVAERFRGFLAGKAAGQRIWCIPDKPVKMMDVDRKAAGILYETNEGFADFHALRHTFCTRIGRSGASIKDAQVLMRHCDIRQTARYMHTTMRHQVNVLEGLPALVNHVIEQRATGTDANIPFRRAATRRGTSTDACRSVNPCGIKASGSLSIEELGLVGPALHRPPEPKVTGSTPVGNVDPSHESQGGNDAATPPSPDASALISALGAARSDPGAGQGDAQTLLQIHAMLAELLRRQAGGGQ